MNMRGRRKPTALKLLEGSTGKRDVVGHRPMPENEPQYTPGTPDRPKTLSPGARRCWDLLVREMAESNVLRRVDGPALAQMCETQALFEELTANVNDYLERTKRANADIIKQYEAEIAAGKKPNKTMQRFYHQACIPPLLDYAASQDGKRVLSILNQSSSSLVVQRREFGLTPSSNTKIEIQGRNDKVDSLEKMLGG